MSKIKKIFIIICMFLFATTISSCKKKEENPTYDGRTFDISINNDNSVIAKTVKVNNNFELIISGQGVVKSYDKKESVPWNAISKKIVSVKIEDGVENIGNYYFYTTTIDKFIIPSSVKKIEENSFNTIATIYSYATTSIDTSCTNNIYYYSESKPATTGTHWHLVGNDPIVWDQYKILFIGNSFTYFPSDLYNEGNPAVCAITKELSENLGIEIIVDFVVKGSYTLKKFADANDEKGKIVDQKLKASSDYDYVILQEQSTRPVDDYNSFSSSVAGLVKKVKDTQDNAQVLLYATWGFPDSVLEGTKFSSVPEMERLIREAYEKCAEEQNLQISYVGKAFTYVYENYKDINLYWGDNKHQAFTGAYLSACVHLSTILPIDIRNATYEGILDENTAAILREVAYNIVNK